MTPELQQIIDEFEQKMDLIIKRLNQDEQLIKRVKSKYQQYRKEEYLRRVQHWY